MWRCRFRLTGSNSKAFGLSGRGNIGVGLGARDAEHFLRCHHLASITIVNSRRGYSSSRCYNGCCTTGRQLRIEEVSTAQWGHTQLHALLLHALLLHAVLLLLRGCWSFSVAGTSLGLGIVKHGCDGGFVGLGWLDRFIDVIIEIFVHPRSSW